MKKNNKKSHLRLVKKNKKRENKIKMNKHKDKFIKQKKTTVLDISKVIDYKKVINVKEFRKNLGEMYGNVKVKNIRDDVEKLKENNVVCDYDLSTLNDDQRFLDVWSCGIRYFLLIDDISSFDDIYQMTNSGFSRLHDKDYVPDRDDPILYSLFPINYEELDNKFKDHMNSGESPHYFHGYFYTDSYLNWCEEYFSEIDKTKPISYEQHQFPISISDHRIRHLFILQFGLFSGWDYSINWTKKRKQQYRKTLRTSGDVLMTETENQKRVELRKSNEYEDLYELVLPTSKKKELVTIRTTSSNLVKLMKDQDNKYVLRQSPESPEIKYDFNDHQRKEITEFVESGRGGRVMIMNDKDDKLEDVDHRLIQTVGKRLMSVK